MAQTITAAIDARGRVWQAQQRDALGPRSARRALLPVRWWWPLPLYQSWCCLRAWRAPQPHQLRRRPADHPHRLVHRCSRHLRHLQHLQKHQEPQRMPLPLQQGLHHHVHQSLPARHARGLLREHQTPRAPRPAARACVHQWLSIPHPEFVHPHFRAARSRRGQFESPQRMRVVILQRARSDAALPHTPPQPSVHRRSARRRPTPGTLVAWGQVQRSSPRAPRACDLARARHRQRATWRPPWERWRRVHRAHHSTRPTAAAQGRRAEYALRCHRVPRSRCLRQWKAHCRGVQ